MKDIQKYIWLLIILSVIDTAFPLLRDIYLAQTYGASDVPALVKANWRAVSFSFVFLVNIAAALWLRYLAIKNGVAVIVWCAFGLFFGLFAVGIFYLVRINEQLKT